MSKVKLLEAVLSDFAFRSAGSKYGLPMYNDVKPCMAFKFRYCRETSVGMLGCLTLEERAPL